MRMRNLPWAKEYLSEHEKVIKQPSKNKGCWNKLLNRDVIHVEIGSGKGDYWTKMALQNNDCGWIGIEKNHSVAALAMKKFDLIQEDTKHMLFIQDDASNIESWFDEGEVDVIHLNFSDPWPKKRAHKKRLSSKTFIEQYAKILKDDGEIQMKSDNKDLFEYSILQFQDHGWFLHDFSVDFRRNESDDVITEYERRFMNLGQPIYRAVWKKYRRKED